jgi:ketosteroid isomerase-like protein
MRTTPREILHAMSDENVETVRRVYEGVNARLEVPRELFEPDYEFDNTELWPDVAEVLGFEAAQTAMREYWKTFEAYRVEIEEVIYADDGRVVDLVRDGGRMRGTDAEVWNHFLHVWTLRDGRIVRLSVHTDRNRALEAAGLSEEHGSMATSHENLDAVQEVIAAVNDRDLDRYLAHCTENIQLETPWTAVEGVYEGADAIRRLFSDLSDTLPDFRLVIERLEPIGSDRVLAFIRASGTGRASGITAGAGAPSATGDGLASANVYDFADGKISRIRVFLDRQEALGAVGLAE